MGAAISPLLAYTMGIALDYRRKNRSQESLKTNVARLTDFRSRIAKLKLIKTKKEESYCILNKPVVSSIHNTSCNTHNIIKGESLKNSNYLTKATAYTTHRMVLAKKRPIEPIKKHK